jgi:Holliday junction resolvase RusA-like endonuclease
MEIEINLPYPRLLSVNNIWKKSRTGVYLNPKVATYRKEIWALFYGKHRFPRSIPITIKIDMFPPRKNCDIDNILKTVLDAMQFAQVYENDVQIHELYVKKHQNFKGGKLIVKIADLFEEDTVVLQHKNNINEDVRR